MPDPFHRLPEVLRLTGLARSTVYALMARGEFPAPVKLSARSVAWRESELNDWMAARSSARATV